VLLASSAVGAQQRRQEAQGLVVDLDQGLGLLQVAQDGFDQLRIEAAAGQAAARSSSGALPSRNNQRASRPAGTAALQQQQRYCAVLGAIGGRTWQRRRPP